MSHADMDTFSLRMKPNNVNTDLIPLVYNFFYCTVSIDFVKENDSSNGVYICIAFTKPLNKQQKQVHSSTVHTNNKVLLT